MKSRFIFLTVLFLLGPTATLAQEPIQARPVDARVITITLVEQDRGLWRYVFEASGDDGQSYMVDTTDSYTSGIGYDLRVGDSVILQVIDEQTGPHAYLADIHRERGLLVALLVFMGITIAVGLRRGILSLVGLAVTVGILLFFLLPALLEGRWDPLLATILASVVILGVNMHLSHGWRRQTTLAFLGTLAGLALTVVFTFFFLRLARLSGLASEEATLLFWELNGLQVPVGILASGIILGAVGVLDDIAITQTEVVHELLIADPSMTCRALFKKAMRVGRHHIASTVNTLVLVYAGAALPVFLLFLQSALSPLSFINNELVAEELVRTLAGTSALVLAVPICTWFATFPHRVIDRDSGVR